MLLHKDRELFEEVIQATAADLNLPVAVVEKDYYVTMILKMLAESNEECVFKGGTSLSKAHHAIDRFSEDIDIAFSSKLTQGQRKNLKNKIIAGISERLELPISDWEKARSRRDYNCYTFAYEPLEGFVPDSLIQGVKMEVALGSISFPTVELMLDSYVYQFLSKENMDIVEEYGLNPFQMRVQSLERTLVDKVFAVCDYYMAGKIKRHSRHLYDIYMLLPKITLDDDFKELIAEVRMERQKMDVCLSAKPEVNVPEILCEIVDKEIYKDDYEYITSYFQKNPLDYENAVSALHQIVESGLFDPNK